MKAKWIEEAVKFIKENPGTTVNRLVEFMDKKKFCAKMTTLKLVDDLKRTGRIEDRKEGNSFHQLYINEKNKFNLIDKELDEIEKIVNMMEDDLLRINDKRNNIDKRLLTAPGPFPDLVFCYLESIYIILRNLLFRTHDTISSDKDSQLLYTRIIMLLLKVNGQKHPNFLYKDKKVLEDYSNLLLQIKIKWGLLKRFDRQNILDDRLIDALTEKIDYFRLENLGYKSTK